jgi:hypothetical protein
MISGGWWLRYYGTLRRMDSHPGRPLAPAALAPRRRGLAVAGVVAVLLIAVVAVVAVVAYAVTRADSAPPARQGQAAVAATSSPPAASASPVVLSTSPAAKIADQAATDACSQAYKAYKGASYDPAKMRAVGQRAAESAVPPLRIQGEKLVEIANHAAKSSDLTSTLALSTAVTELATYCLNNRLFNP